MLYLYRAQEAEGDRVGTGERLGTAGADAALELTFSSTEISEALQGAGRFVREACLGEEDSGRLAVSAFRVAQVVFCTQQSGNGLLLVVGCRQASCMNDPQERDRGPRPGRSGLASPGTRPSA